MDFVETFSSTQVKINFQGLLNVDFLKKTLLKDFKATNGDFFTSKDFPIKYEENIQRISRITDAIFLRITSKDIKAENTFS